MARVSNSYEVFSLLNALKEYVPLGSKNAPLGQTQSMNWSVTGVGSVLYFYIPVKSDSVFTKDGAVSKDRFLHCLKDFGLNANYDSKEGGILVSGEDAAKVLKAGSPDQSAHVSKLAFAITGLKSSVMGTATTK